MTRISWGTLSERFYEGGVDRGVFYLGTNPGVPWNGIQSVAEGVGAAAPRPFYYDGIKYLNLSGFSDYEATITALAPPEGFDACEGRTSVVAGLLATEQRKAKFGLSYRSLIGNAEDGLNHGYKIHLVYNALASKGETARNTLSAAADPNLMSWGISTNPPITAGIRPTAHFVVDSRTADETALAALEDILYGSVTETPRLPDPDELITILGG